MSRFREWNVRNKVYVGGLTDAVEKDEIESVFRKYGPVKNSWIAKNPAGKKTKAFYLLDLLNFYCNLFVGFGFIEFENQRDAEDAVKNLDGTRCCGVKIKVEMSNGRSRGGGRFERHDRFRGGGGRDRDRRRFRFVNISGFFVQT